MNILARIGRPRGVPPLAIITKTRSCSFRFQSTSVSIFSGQRRFVKALSIRSHLGSSKFRHGTGAASNCFNYNYSTSSTLGERNDAIYNDDRFDAFHNNNNNNRFGRRLRNLLEKNHEHENLANCWNQADQVLKESLQDLRILRARTERLKKKTNLQGTIRTQNERQQLLLDCLVLFDALSESLPRAEEYSSSWLSSSGGTDSANASASANASSFTTAAAFVLDQNLWNEFLKEWMMAWKQQHNGSPNKKFPTPSQMADHVDRYRSRCLVEPDPTSYNLLLNAMIHGRNNNASNAATINSNSNNTNPRIKAIKLADDYLRRLLDAQQQHQQSLAFHQKINYVDTVSITTVMQGWVTLGQPRKAQEWLDVMEEIAAAAPAADTTAASDETISPNAIAYSTLIHGWARRGEPLEAEAVLERAIEYASNQIINRHQRDIMYEQVEDGNDPYYPNSNHNNVIPLVDRVVFHTVLDAWGNKSASSRNDLGGDNNNNNNKRKIKSKNQSKNDSMHNPSLRAKALVQKMNDLADQHPLWFGDILRPNDETWHKLIAVVASSTPHSHLQKPHKQEVGPHAAEKLLLEFEETRHNSNNNHSSSSTQAVLLNRILQAYCSTNNMEEAEAFFYRRCQHLEGTEASSLSTTSPTFPNDVTFNTILSGWATEARVAAKTKKKISKKWAFEIPLRAQAWLETMQEHNFPPSTRSFGSVLQAWSLSTKFHNDAANRAEDLLRKRVWPLLLLEEEHWQDPDLARGVVICTNICLRAWSNQASSSEMSMARCLRLLSDFLDLVEKHWNANQEEEIKLLRPTEETFRAVLHAICTPSKNSTPVQKHDQARALLSCMKDRFRLRPSKGDLAKFERLKQRRDSYFASKKE